MADQPSNPSNLAKIRELVETLADRSLDGDERRNAVKDTLGRLGVEPSGDLDQLLEKAPPAKEYEKLLADLEAYEDYLISLEFLEKVCKLGAPPLFGMHCPMKLGHPGGP